MNFRKQDSKNIQSAKLIIAAMLLSLSTGGAPAQSSTDALMSGFQNPPNSARPRVWWHWMNGNISQEGIKLDLDWMHHIGLAGFQNFDAALATPQVVKQRLAYMTPEWKDAFKYATTLADQYGFEEAIAGSPGWSETGGPWVPASQGMKKYVWSETYVTGGKPFTGVLAHPPSKTGAFQDLNIRDLIPSPDGNKAPPQFYADAAVIAYRRPASDVPVESLHPRITASNGTVDAAQLTDGLLEKTTGVPIPEKVGDSSWIQYEFPETVTMQSITVSMDKPNGIVAMIAGLAAPEVSLAASNDGQTFHEVTKLPDSNSPQNTFAFPAEKAKYFRVLFKRTPPPPLPPWISELDPASLGIKMGDKPTTYQVAELKLHPGARTNHFEEKAAFVPVPDLYEFASPSVSPADAIHKSDVIDLTGKMRPDGTLDWTPPNP